MTAVMSFDDNSASCGGGVLGTMGTLSAQNDKIEIQHLVGERLSL
jgi:predicted outer membrane repeat protein